MSSGATTWASLGRRDERKKDDRPKRVVVGGEIKKKEKKRGRTNTVEEGHPNHHRHFEDVVEKKLKSAHNQNKQTNISFARIDRKEHFETIKKATRVETIELSECDLEEEEEDDDDDDDDDDEVKIVSENRGEIASSSSQDDAFLQLPKALRQRPAFIDALSTKDATREDVLREVEEYENKAKKLSEECSRAAYKLCVRIRGREYQASEVKTKLPKDGAKVYIERDMENVFDATGAMQILDDEKRVLGYVPRRVAGEFAGLVDLGVVEVSGTLRYAREEGTDENESSAWVEIEIKVLTNITNVFGIQIDTPRILNGRFESATRANAEEFESESWAWLRTKDKIVEAIAGLTNAEFLLSEKEKEIRQKFIDVVVEESGGNDAALLATRLLARGHAWISDCEKKEYVAKTNDAMRKLVQHSFAYDLSSNESHGTDKGLAYVFDRDFCLNNLTVEEMKHMMSSFQNEGSLLNEHLRNWRQEYKTKDRLMIPLRALYSIDENKEVWMQKWKESKESTHPNWIVLSPTFITLVRIAICVAYRKRLSVSCIYDAISGVRRYPMVSSNRNSSEVLESPWKSRADMLAYFEAMEVLRDLERFNEANVYGFTLSVENAPKLIERGKCVETSMLEAWRRGSGISYDADLLDPKKDMERFSHHAVECRICYILVIALEKLAMASIKLVNNEPNEIQGRAHRRCAVGYLTRAINLLRALLAQPFDARRRGKWYDRLYVDLGHLKEYQKQFDVCKAALEDSWVVWDDLANMRDKVCSIASSKNKGVKVPSHYQLPAKFTMVEDKLHGVPLPQEFVDRKKREQGNAEWKGTRKFYDIRDLSAVDTNGKPTDAIDLTEELVVPAEIWSVEAYSLVFYEQKFGWKGIHTELSLWYTLLPLLNLDVFFHNEFSDIGFNPWPLEFQSLPLDYSEPEWILRRERVTQVTLEKIRKGHGTRLLVENWAKWYGTESHTVRWTTVKEGYTGTVAVTEQKRRLLSLTELCEVVRCFDNEQLYKICARWILDPVGTIAQGGMPDLFLWNPEKSEAMCVEVKSTGDQIQNNQKACINMLKEANFSVKCLKVNDFVCEYDWDSRKKKKK
ncbi:unnamed protein product [Bathycoccus prasinos]